MIPVDVRSRSVSTRSDESELELRKVLAIARGNLARLKARRDIETLRAWSARASRTAQTTTLIWAVASAISAWRKQATSGSTSLNAVPALLGVLSGWLSRRARIDRDT